jgi:phosphoribosylformylglycinamidine synthase subunit PurS
MIWQAEVVVHLKPVVNDPQGLVVRDGLRRMGFGGVGSVRVGKHIVLEVDAPDELAARTAMAEMCERLLRNPVIEDYRIDTVRPMANAVEVA